MTDDAGFADKMNAMPKYVVSTTLDRPGVEQHDGAPGRRPTRWPSSSSGRGRHPRRRQRQLHQGLVARGLVDEWRLMVFPIVLGSGKRLFGDAADLTGLELVDSRQLASGSLYLTYRAVSA